MCLSTIYREEKEDKNILARFVSEIRAEDGYLIFRDVMGAEIKVRGSFVSADLTGGAVVVRLCEDA